MDRALIARAEGPEPVRGAGEDAWTHLHVHSQYTLLGSAASIEHLVERALAEGLSHLALTDANALYGAVRHARACQEAGLQPIIGMTAPIALPEDLRAHARDGAQTGLLVLLAAEPAGYRSLCRLSTMLQGQADREARIARGLGLDDLRAHREGLICLSGGRRGWIERLLRADEQQAARAYAGRLAATYGQGTYLSLELHHAADAEVARQVSALGAFLGVPTVAVQPVYCLHRQDVPRLKLLAAIDRNCTLDEVPAEALPNSRDPQVDVHWLGGREMAERFAAFPGALARTAEVAARCGPVLPDGRPIFPTLELPEGRSPEEALTRLARAGLAARYGETPPPAAAARLEVELQAIAGHGYAPLFVIVADIVRFARENEISVSTRGSVANSLVAYCTGITTVDPVAQDLLFERFLSPARTGGSASDAPDIDLDFCSRRRDEVLDYVRRTYGADRVALVATVSTMRLRSAVRETAKARGLDADQIETLCAGLPRGWHPDPRRRDRRSVADIIAEASDPVHQTVLREAAALAGAPHHLGVHPGGVVITPGPLTDLLPVQWSPKGFLVSQYDHVDLETLGLTKLDLLGIRALTVLADAVRLVRRDHAADFRLDDIPGDDPGTADMLQRGDTVGVFQCESAGMRSTLIKLKARRAPDLAIANAFFKPGPALGGMAHTFVRRYRGEEPVRYLHPALEPILGSTKGVLIFQEQILRIAVEVAGLSWAQADQLRRGVKFRAEAMEEMEAQFLSGCQRPAPTGPGFTARQAQTLWEQIVPFSGYGFNRGHATAYAEVSYRSAYIKAHWPAAFLCARLMNWGGFHHPAVYMAEALRLGIAIRAPHVNHSERAFSLSWEDDQAVLWMGLGWVRDLRRRAVRAIRAARRRRPFASLRDLAMRVPLQRRELEHLVQCGALDGLGESRAALLVECGEILRAESALQLSLDLGRPEVAPEPLA
ncbi:MAG: DNA polymerase III subunit alpha, partial [Anaerolineae bacterium]|nr:DNA polymerase III subunit alpha [Anaerolineae bacterium]